MAKVNKDKENKEKENSSNEVPSTSMEEKIMLILEKKIMGILEGKVMEKLACLEQNMTELKATLSELMISKTKHDNCSIASTKSVDTAVQTECTHSSHVSAESATSLEYLSCNSTNQSDMNSNVLKPLEDFIVHPVLEIKKEDVVECKSVIDNVYERAVEEYEEVESEKSDLEMIDQNIQCVEVDLDAGGEKIVCATEVSSIF